MTNNKYTLHHGDCLEVLKFLPANSVDAIVCDPPAGINFMNVGFDSDRGGRDQHTKIHLPTSDAPTV